MHLAAGSGEHFYLWEDAMNPVRLLVAVVIVGSLVTLGCGQIEHQGICGGGYLLCDYDCVDPITDTQNCGSCGLVCREGEVCSMGRCQNVAGIGSPDHYREYVRPTGQLSDRELDEPELCGGDARDGRIRCGEACVNTLTDRSHCGGCFNTCPGGTFCRSGECTPECPAGLTNCAGMCVNVLAIREHCGACDRACDAGQVCTGGECMVSCDPGLTDCGGACVNVWFDRENCGGCGEPCADGEACVNGGCTFDCPGDETNCDGVCADLMTDPEHCGLCNHDCEPDETCVHGTCEVAPAGGDW